MDRDQMIEVVEELLDILNQKKITPDEASNIGDMFKKNIEENNEKGVRDFLRKGEFVRKRPAKNGQGAEIKGITIDLPTHQGAKAEPEELATAILLYCEAAGYKVNDVFNVSNVIRNAAWDVKEEGCKEIAFSIKKEAEEYPPQKPIY